MNTVKLIPNCTVLIPTYNRPKYLKRLLKYYSQCTKYKFNILISDSSSKPNKQINKKNSSLYFNLDIKYFEHPKNISIFNKLLIGLNSIKTKYCVINADDDFIIPEGIVNSVDYLERNKDFQIAHGDYLHYSLDNNKQIKWKRTYTNLSQISPKPSDRLISHLSNYPSPATFYAVHRTSFLSTIINEVIKLNIKQIILNELYFAGLSAIYSKIISLDCLYSIKNSEYLREDYIMDLREIIKDDSNSIDFNKFKDNLSYHLYKVSGMNLKKNKMIIDKTIKNYYKYMFNPLSLPTIKIKKIFYKFKLISLYDKLRKYYKFINPRTNEYHSINELSDNYLKYFSEVSKLL